MAIGVIEQGDGGDTQLGCSIAQFPVRAAPSSVSFSFSAEASPCVKHIVAGPDCRGYLQEMIMHREADVRAFAAAADIEARPVAGGASTWAAAGAPLVSPGRSGQEHGDD
jgi:hypothetical protein